MLILINVIIIMKKIDLEIGTIIVLGIISLVCIFCASYYSNENAKIKQDIEDINTLYYKIDSLENKLDYVKKSYDMIEQDYLEYRIEVTGTDDWY